MRVDDQARKRMDEEFLDFVFGVLESEHSGSIFTRLQIAMWEDVK